jgi:hypothetical protein
MAVRVMERVQPAEQMVRYLAKIFWKLICRPLHWLVSKNIDWKRQKWKNTPNVLSGSRARQSFQTGQKNSSNPDFSGISAGIKNV